MKKLILSMAVAAIATLSASAQKEADKTLKFGVGVTAGLPMADIKTASSFALKGDLQAEYAVAESLGITASAGYLKYIAKSGYETGSAVPVL